MNNVERAARLDAATISDAMDRLGVVGQCLGIKPLGDDFRLAGRAVTLLYKAADSRKPGSVGDYIDDIEPGSVLVLDNGGREDATVWGDILTFTAFTRGVAGTVIDGACRDVRLCRELGYPVFSRSWSMRTGKDRVQLDAMNVPVTIGQARVSPGDLMFGDADGVVVVPRAAEEEVLQVAEEIDAAERRIRAAVETGSRLDEARKANRYFELQRREGKE